VSDRFTSRGMVNKIILLALLAAVLVAACGLVDVLFWRVVW
jgi:hypothetical protein